MTRWMFGLVLFVMVTALAPAQQDDRALQAYQERFREALPETKLAILENADLLTVEQMGPLYVQAVEYSLSDRFKLNSDTVTRDIALTAVAKIAEARYLPAVSALWMLFTEYEETVGRVATLGALESIGAGNAQLVVDLNRWVTSQVQLHQAGVVPDQQVLWAAVNTLGTLGDGSSFPVLLDAELTHVSERVSRAARSSMRALNVDFVREAVDTIRGRTVGNKLTALRFFLEDAGLPDEDRARIAAGALEDAVGLVVRGLNDEADLPLIRFHATRVLMNVPYPPAADALVLSFDQTFRDYDLGIVAKAWVLDAVSALGATEAEAAVVRLVSFLELLNTYTENDRTYDNQIVLAVVDGLGRIGNPVAYDALFHTSLFDYSDEVKEATRRALAALQE